MRIRIRANDTDLNGSGSETLHKIISYQKSLTGYNRLQHIELAVGPLRLLFSHFPCLQL